MIWILLELSDIQQTETFLNKYPEYKGRQFVTSQMRMELGMILEGVIPGTGRIERRMPFG